MKNISGIIGEFTGEKADYHVAEMAASDCSSEKGQCSQTTSSLHVLGWLKFTEPSELAKKREVKVNPPVRVKRSQRRSLLRLSRSPTQRVKESSVSRFGFSLRIIGGCLGNNFFSRKNNSNFFRNKRIE